MEEQLTALLLNAASLTALVPANKIHWGRAPDNTTPIYMTMQVVSGLNDYHMQGASGYVSTRIQFDVYASTYEASKNAARALKSVLSGYKGEPFLGIFIDSERDLPAADAGNVSVLFRTSIDFIIHHQEN